MTGRITTEEAEKIAGLLAKRADEIEEYDDWTPGIDYPEGIVTPPSLSREAAAALRSLAAERDAMREALRENGRLGCNTCLEVLDALGENQPTEDAPPPIPPRPYEPDRMP